MTLKEFYKNYGVSVLFDHINKTYPAPFETKGKAELIARATVRDFGGLKMREDLEDIDDIVNLIRGIQGVRVAVHIKPRGENVYKLSLRCEQGFNVSQIAGQFGGGGHPCAAGCTIEDTVEGVEAAIVAAISAAFDAEACGEGMEA